MPAQTVEIDDLSGIADADEAEAAAIAAAIAAHCHSQERAAAAAAAAADAEDESSRRSWQFAGRLAGLGINAARPPETTPTSGWAAADRADRF